MQSRTLISTGRAPAEVTLTGKKWRRRASSLWHPLEIKPRDRGFSTALHVASLGPSSVSRVEHAACRVYRSLKGIGEADTDSVVYIHNAGAAPFVGHQHGRSVLVASASAAFFMSGVPYELHFGDATQVVVLQTPRSAVPMSPERLGAAAARAAAPDAGPAFVLARLLGGLLDAPASASGHAEAPQRAIADLLSWSLDDIAHSAGFEETVRSHLYREVRSYIGEHPDIAAVTPDAVAAAFFMSRRSLYQLFAEHGATPAAAIRAEALSRSRTLLLDRRHSVGDVAVLVGFQDPTAFARAFRRHYGSPPGAWRTIERAEAHGV